MMPSRYTKGCSRAGLLAILALQLLGGFTYAHASPYEPVYQDAPVSEHVSSTTAAMAHETTTSSADMVHGTTTAAMAHETAAVVSTKTVHAVETVQAVETIHQTETVHVVESVPVTERVTEHVTIHQTQTVQRHVTELKTVCII